MTDTLKNLVTSVDWSKLMSRADTRNALVGSALGGLMLGGASMAQDRDPEESKLTPVGDALMGAVLGGVAGYGIPKGLAMFRDGGGHMAPDNDKLPTGLYGYADSASKGAIGGLGLMAAGHAVPMYKSFLTARKIRGATARSALLHGGMLNVLATRKMRPAADGKPKSIKNIFRILGDEVTGRGYKRRRRIATPFSRIPLKAGIKTQMLMRGGKLAAGGATLMALLHALTGPSSKDNFKN